VNCPICDGSGLVWEMDGPDDAGLFTCIACIEIETKENDMTETTPHCQEDLFGIARSIEKRITDMGFAHAEAGFRIPGYFGRAVDLFIEGSAGDDVSFRNCFTDEGDGASIDIDAICARADAWLDDLKSPDEQIADAFRQQLGRLLDRARDLGHSVGAAEMAINPLTELMKQLSENAIEYRTAAE
jgi:hypothetical protein